MSVSLEKTLRAVRKLGPKSLKAIADEVGVTPKTILAWEKADGEPSITNAEKHALSIGITYDEYRDLWREARSARDEAARETRGLAR